MDFNKFLIVLQGSYDELGLVLPGGLCYTDKSIVLPDATVVYRCGYGIFHKIRSAKQIYSNKGELL
ncbi:MAG: hypothetical protein IKI88_06170 [Anaerotignum sp.]|nr:hypothetical protein [Anaerotignum sp.]